MNKLFKQRNLVLAVLALVAIAGIVCYLMLGFGAGARFDGVKRYSATIATADFDPETFDIKTMESDLRTALGKDVDVSVSLNYTSGVYELCVSVSPASYALLIDNATTMLSEKYPDLGIESFTERNYAPAQGPSAVGAMFIVLGIVWVLSYLAAGITVGFKDGLPVFVLAVLNTLCVFAIYVFTRMDSFPLLCSSLIATAVATLFYGSPRVAALDRAYRSGSQKDPSAACAETASRENAIGAILLAVAVVAAFCAASIFVGVKTIMPVGILLGCALVVSMLSTGLALPGMWAASHRK